MVYVDTSAFVPMFVREAASDAVIDWIESSGEQLAVSEWTLVEFASALSIKAREGRVGPALLKRATVSALQFARNHCTVATPQREEFRRASDLVANPTLGLRAGDALHLAIAENLNASAVLCLDRAMVTGARKIGVSTVSPA